jgi:predicted secreted protein
MARWAGRLRGVVVAALFVAAEGMVVGRTGAALHPENYSGVLPCADCSGIRTTLALNRSDDGAPVNYTMIETFVGRPAAGKPRVTGGSWTIERGDAADKNATVYQLHPAGSSSGSRSGSSSSGSSSTGMTSFVKVGAELRLLGGDMAELPASVPHTLKLIVADKIIFKVNNQEDGELSARVGGVLEVRLHGVLEVQLPANHTTGYSWVAAPVANPILAMQGKAAYQESAAGGKAGVGGVETWRFKAVKAGTEGLKFEYRRPWEKDVPAAKTVTIQVTAQ